MAAVAVAGGSEGKRGEAETWMNSPPYHAAGGGEGITAAVAGVGKGKSRRPGFPCNSACNWIWSDEDPSTLTPHHNQNLQGMMIPMRAVSLDCHHVLAKAIS